MFRIIKDGTEVIAFILLTLSLYFLFMVTAPILRESHGLLVLADLADSKRGGLILYLLFVSVIICILLGVLLLKWTPFFSSSILANLFATTFIFMWIDAIFTLFIQTRTWAYFFSLGTGVLFIYLFFFVLEFLGIQRDEANPIFHWKKQLIPYWLWGWMGFYFGLSSFLIFYSLTEQGSRLPLAMGAMVVCFMNYLLNLHIKKSQGKEIESFSRVGRVFFTVWALGILALWLGYRWLI